ncbi:hypothetical protein G6F37_000515 [Rhizopus arrhizus]|nr:hypothetical protein G6F38_000602 [Rhizopus arrhizus]KAG1164189.1 hypothetical protein G6F37_000515 [Rhizopus arrhizus]
MSTFSLSIDNRNNYNLFDNYLNNNKSIKPLLPSENTCFSEEESDSTMKKEEMDSDNDSLIEYTKNTKKNKKMIENEKKQKNLYKTELCRNWEETGQCRYGTKCQYAHGAQDLREIERHPKYKTQKCRTFHKTGSCPYGARCTFRHFSLPGDEDNKEEPVMFPTVAENTMQPKIFFGQHQWSQGLLMGEHYTRRNPLGSPFDLEDSLLPTNAESLLPHQLLFDLEQPIPTQQEDSLCKSFFRPWLI